jgi:hypothetical protein
MGDVAERIRQAVTSWPGVTAHPHRFGGVEFRLAHREIGHLHGDRLADLPFPRRIRDELIAAGQAKPHHVLPDSGWVSRVIRSADDVEGVIALFRMNYDRVTRIGGQAPEDRS